MLRVRVRRSLDTGLNLAYRKSRLYRNKRQREEEA